MTIITGQFEDVAGAPHIHEVYFDIPRMRSAPGAVVTTDRHPFELVDGELTTSNMHPGPATVYVGHQAYRIVIPDSPNPVDIWPLIDAGMPTPPPEAPGFVRDGGGIRRAIRVSPEELAAMGGAYDPGTLIFVSAPATYSLDADGAED